MKKLILLIETIVYVISALLFTQTGEISFLWVISIVDILIVWKEYNYSTARIIMFFSLFLITLCGNTNYLMFCAIADFVITITIVLLGDHTISSKWKVAVPWIVLTLTGSISGLLFALDKTFYHVGVEVYVLLLLILLSSEFLSGKQTIAYSIVLRNICAINAGIVALFFSTNTFSDLLIKARALIYLLGETGIRSNTLGGIIVVFMAILFFSRIMFENIYDKVILYSILLLDVVILIFLQSRGSYVALAIIFLISSLEKILVDKNFNRSDMIKAFLTSAVAIILIFLPSIQNVLNNYVFARFFNRTDISNGRFDTYLKSIDVWLEHPLCGHGFLQYAALEIENADPHNFILGYLISTGLIGTMAFLVFLIKVYNSKGSRVMLNRAFKYAVLAQIVHGLFEPVLTQNLPLSLFIVICVLTVDSKRLEYIEDE